MRSSLRHFAAALPLLVATTLVGCDAGLGVEVPADAPSVQVMAAVVVPATNVNLLLTNSSTANWGYNGCDSPRLQRREGDTWVDGPRPLIICTAELSILSAGVARTVAYAVPGGLAPATYRLRYRFIRGAGIEVFPETNSFVVQ
jgi:hypothetical protein